MASLEKIENFINDSSSSAYKDILESSESYNTRLCIERRLRMPFLDPQTGTAQNHCALFKKSRQRMPGLREGQIYTYPAARWKKSRRQYLIQRPYRPPAYKHPEIDVDYSNHSSHGDNIPLSLASVTDMEGKDTHGGKEEINKEWYYDEMDLNDMDGYDDADPDSDFDYEEPYSIRKKGKKGKNSEGSTRKQKVPASERTGSETPAKKSSSRRGRKSKLNLDGDRSSSPMAYSSKKSRHSMQIHDDHSNSSFVANMDSPHPVTTPHMPPHQQPLASQMLTPRPELFGNPSADPTPIAPVSVNPPVQAGSSEPGGLPIAATATNEKDHSRRGEKGKLAAPSPYCDFCLGDTRENKKTGTAEELVSCSDCGRSGHPSCLQFTANMMISVKRYRWQCIECKYCSICGTSDNDDQLLFCDDCDRGYHMYCLSPALTAPPEGSWSCKLCIDEFHTPKPKGSSNVPPPTPPVSAAPVTSAITQQLQQPPVTGPPPPQMGGPPGHPQMPYGPPPTAMMHGGPGMHPGAGMPPQMGPHPGGPHHHPPPPPHGMSMHGMPPQGGYGPPLPQPGTPSHAGSMPPTTHANHP